MENKVYYGEYTLKHWIKLMLSGNIVLPEYQRHFVWRERDLKRLLQSLSDGQFVQPVTIALYDDSSIRQNFDIGWAAEANFFTFSLSRLFSRQKEI